MARPPLTVAAREDRCYDFRLNAHIQATHVPELGPWLLGIHYALRQRGGKTVMSLRNSRPANKPTETRGNLNPKAISADRRNLDQLFSLTYEELRRLASTVKRGDPSATLSPTALVNEAWLKLSKSPGFASASRLHFKRIAARAMRQLLIEAARRRNANKRGGGADVTVTFDDSFDEKPASGQDLLALDAALEELARMNPRQAMMVESRFFGGFDIAETAELLDVSEATVLRDWRAAKAWLAHELRRAR
jgi:RNA polymerase sigma factor (TIGR02999 family)